MLRELNGRLGSKSRGSRAVPRMAGIGASLPFRHSIPNFRSGHWRRRELLAADPGKKRRFSSRPSHHIGRAPGQNLIAAVIE